MKKKKKPLNTILKICFLILFIIVSSLMLHGVFKEFNTMTALKKDLQNTHTTYAELVQQKKEVQKETQNLQDVEYQKMFCRGNFLLTREDEQIFVFKN